MPRVRRPFAATLPQLRLCQPACREVLPRMWSEPHRKDGNGHQEGCARGCRVCIHAGAPPADHHVLRPGGSSALSTRLDPEVQGDVIAAFHTCCANEIKTLGGMVAQYLGDGVLAYFGYPTAHENDAERAILAGLAIIKAVASLKPTADVVLQTRIAIGSGVVVVGDLVGEGVTQENAAIGETTNLVARLQALAEPNTLVISPVTHRLVGALFDYRDLGRLTLKGFAEPVHARQVLGPSKIESRFEAQRQTGLSPLLGGTKSLKRCCGGGSR